MGGIQALNVAVQAYLRGLCAHSRKRNQAILLDQASLPWFVELNRALTDRSDGPAFRDLLIATNRRLRELATEILDRCSVVHPGMDGSALRVAIDDAGGPVREGRSLLFPALVDVVEGPVHA